MRRRNQQTRYARQGVRHIGEIMPNVLAQYGRVLPASTDSTDRRRPATPAKPTQKVFTFAR